MAGKGFAVDLRLRFGICVKRMLIFVFRIPALDCKKNTKKFGRNPHEA